MGIDFAIPSMAGLGLAIQGSLRDHHQAPLEAGVD